MVGNQLSGNVCSKCGGEYAYDPIFLARDTTAEVGPICQTCAGSILYGGPQAMTPDKFYIPLSAGVCAGADERYRQIFQEGYSPEHDDEHTDGGLAFAAAAYAVDASAADRKLNEIGHEYLHTALWPWEPTSFKPCDGSYEGRLKSLRKAMALIAAEYDRLQRQESA